MYARRSRRSVSYRRRGRVGKRKFTPRRKFTSRYRSIRSRRPKSCMVTVVRCIDTNDNATPNVVTAQAIRLTDFGDNLTTLAQNFQCYKVNWVKYVWMPARTVGFNDQLDTGGNPMRVISVARVDDNINDGSVTTAKVPGSNELCNMAGYRHALFNRPFKYTVYSPRVMSPVGTVVDSEGVTAYVPSAQDRRRWMSTYYGSQLNWGKIFFSIELTGNLSEGPCYYRVYRYISVTFKDLKSFDTYGGPTTNNA